MAGKGASIESTYQKKSQLEHILLRPDTYIGSIEYAQEQMWVYDQQNKCMVQREIKYVPGLYKIFDEILVNAADNKQRDQKMSGIRIDINPDTNTISVWNNGKGIPVAMHKDENMYVPTMIFGHLLTSSNYDDEEEKVVGGRNGYGAKLCNIFSTKFTVETASSEYHKHFKQTWGDNMSKASEPKITPYSGEDFTKITFSPDLKKFKMDRLDEDIVALMARRAFDVAASTKGVRVMLNDERIPVKNFKDYIDLYLKNEENDIKVVHEVINDRWEVGVAVSDKGFQQVSFVNSIATTKGGRHVDYVADIIVKQLLESIKKKNKGGVNIKPFQVKNHMWLFVNCLIVNPAFDSQTKENMTTQSKKFGSKCDIPEKFIQTYSKSGIVEQVLSWAKFKAQNELAKHSGKKQSKLKGIPKLEDANEAGTKNAHKCTLILTEGDSAKCLAVSGLGVVGRDHFGVFPLRGKLLNVRDATHKQILENAEINNLIKIIGLQYKKKYTSLDDIKTLRYGKVMIMTDQDQDGSHIKGLIINFIHTFWPDLLQQNFLEVFITPIVKVFKKGKEMSFYSLPEFEEWKQNTPDHASYSVKYYKGLGTSTSKEAKEYFQDMNRHRIALKYSGNEDDQNIILAFSKKQIEGRKDWLLKHNEDLKKRKELGLPEIYLYEKGTKNVSYTEYVNKELVHYSNGDNIRSIPSVVDGLKPGQRKVMYTCFLRNDKREVKVAQLAGSVAERSAYHHGEQSLCTTIVNLAQNFVGSNNINLLEPRGQFGTRLNGGKDAASARYIFTKMSPLTRLIFNPNDDHILKYEIDDNQKVEPMWYIPIIPMILVNGSDGIGTGWRSKVPNYNPRELVANLFALINNEEIKPMVPWYKNFKGTINACVDQRYIASGEIAIIGDDTVEITELPIGTWTQTYKENVLEPMLHGTEKTKAVLADYKEYSTDTTVRFIITTLPGQLALLQKEGLHNAFKLQTILYTSTMVLFDRHGGIKKYENESEILQDFYTLRLFMYAKRKEYMEDQLDAESQRLTYQAKFIVEKCSGSLVVENKKRVKLVEELVERGYPPDPVKLWKERRAREMKEEVLEDEPENEEEAEESAKKETESDKDKSIMKNYDYLLGMSMWMLTLEKKNQLLKQRDDKLTELSILREKKPSDLWIADLEEFTRKLDEVEEKERKDNAETTTATSKSKKNVKKVEPPTTTTGQRVEPRLSLHITKFTKQQVSKEKKLKKENKKSEDLEDESGISANEKETKKKAPKVKKETDDKEEKDEFDLMFESDTKTLKEKLLNKPESKITTGKSNNKASAEPKKRGPKKKTDGLVQTKLAFSSQSKTAKPKKTENKENIIISDSDSDDFTSKPKKAVRKITNKPQVYIDSDIEEVTDKAEKDKGKNVKSNIKRKARNTKKVRDSFTESDESDEDSFSVVSSDSEEEKVKNKNVKSNTEKRGRNTKKNPLIDSDEESYIEEKSDKEAEKIENKNVKSNTETKDKNTKKNKHPLIDSDEDSHKEVSDKEEEVENKNEKSNTKKRGRNTKKVKKYFTDSEDMFDSDESSNSDYKIDDDDSDGTPPKKIRTRK